MIRLFLAYLFMVSVPLPLLSETVVVKSGDHADFSRLLLGYDGGTDWTFGRVEGGYEFRPHRTDLEWDFRRTFELISRDRVSGLEDRGDGRLFVAVACECHSDVFALRDGQVVIDIKDGPVPIPSSPFEDRLVAFDGTDVRNLAPNLALHTTNGPDGRGLADGASLADSRAGLPLFVPLGPPNPTKPTTVLVEAHGSPGAPNRDSSATTMSEAVSNPRPRVPNRVAETEAVVLEQIARAATQGMIDADMSRIEREVQSATDPLPAPEAEVVTPTPFPVPPPAVAPRSHVSIETAVDRAIPRYGQDVPAAEGGSICIDPSYFDIASWGKNNASWPDIGAYRSQLIGEFDRADGNAITNLARYYLFLTFGAETKALLRQFPSVAERPDILEAMADIMDRGSAKNPDMLAEQMACDGATALWAALAQPRLTLGMPINTKAVTLAFSALPAHLRRHLGPGLGQKFLDMGDEVAAQRIHNAIKRGVQDDIPELGLLSARLDLVDGRGEAAASVLAQSEDQDGEALAEVLIAKVQTLIDLGQSIPPDEIALLQSLGFEFTDTEIGADLLENEIRARAASNDLSGAFDRLNATTDDVYFPPARVSELENEIFSALLRDSGDQTFLMLVVPRLDRARLLPASIRRAIAMRFLSVGLSATARSVLEGVGEPPDKDDRALFARAALLDQRPDIAVGYLAGLDDSEANILRAESLEAAGEYERAAQLFESLGQPDRAISSAWRGGIWSSLAERDIGALATAAALMIGRPVPAFEQSSPEGTPAPELMEVAGPDPVTPLAQSQALIDQSRATRAVLDALFDEIPALPELAGS